MNEQQQQQWEARHRRRKEEFDLGKQFLDIVMMTGKKMDTKLHHHHQQQQQQRAKANGISNSSSSYHTGGLTKAEEPVFKKHTYYSWGYGMIAGISVVAALVGASRWRSRSKLRLPSSIVSEDAILRKNLTTSTNQSTKNFQQQQQRSLSDEIMTEVQMITFGAVAVVTTVVTASVFSDYRRLFRELAVLPLQPGKSYLCKHMCPLVIQQANQLTSEQQLIWDDPETEELEHIRKMVLNCQQRIQFEDKQRTILQLDPDTVVDVPEPGVPIQYQLD